MILLLEEKDEDIVLLDVYIRILIIEVLLLGQRELKEKFKGKICIIDIFVSIDILVQQVVEGEIINGKRQLISKGGR